MRCETISSRMPLQPTRSWNPCVPRCGRMERYMRE